MHIGIGTIYLVLILAKILGLVTLGWFWVITSIIWLPLIAFLAFTVASAIFAGIVAGVIYLLER